MEPSGRRGSGMGRPKKQSRLGYADEEESPGKMKESSSKEARVDVKYRIQSDPGYVKDHALVLCPPLSRQHTSPPSPAHITRCVSLCICPPVHGSNRRAVP